MQLCSFSLIDQARKSYGIVQPDGVIDLGARLGDSCPDLKTLLQRGGLSDLQVYLSEPVDYAFSAIRFLPVVENPGKVFCVGMNYADKRQEFAATLDAPTLFAGRPHIVSNLPYNVGTALLVGWLTSDWQPWWQSCTLMFQKEVADRIVADAGDDAYGRLAVLSQWRSTARIAMPVHRSAFTPPPKVMSAVVHIVPGEAPDGVDVRVLERVTAAAFGQRRKMLRQSLKGVPGALAALERLGLDATRRAETVSVAEFVALARQVGAGA